jgi:alkaline phosphatase
VLCDGVPRTLLTAVLLATFFLVLADRAQAAAPVCSTVKGSSGAQATLCITDYPMTLDNSLGLANPTGFYAATSSVTGKTSSTVLGCPGQRLVPTLCVTWTINGVYSLTDLYSPFQWQLHPMFQPAGKKTVTATAYVDGATLSASVPLTVTGSATPAKPSPNSGKIPGVVPRDPNAVVIATVGDSPASQPSAKNVANLIASWSPDMLFYLGDVYQYGSYQEFLNHWYPSTLFGRFDAITAPVAGNHEYKRWTNAAPYYWYWNYRIGAPTATKAGQYYSFDLAGWHIIALDSDAPHDAASPQLAWLQQDIAAHPNSQYPCTIAIWHRARHSTGGIGGKPSTQTFWGAMVTQGVDIFLNAHAHDYERSFPLRKNGTVAPDGIGVTQFVVGTGGNTLGAWSTTAPTTQMAYRTNTVIGAMKLILRPGQAEFKFTAVGGTTWDAGTIPCH